MQSVNHTNMITQQTFADVINAQAPFFEKSTVIQCKVLQQIPEATCFATIITGLRRCGKSTLH